MNSTLADGLLRVSPGNSDYVAALRHYLDGQDALASGLVLYNDTPGDRHTATLYEAYREQLAPYIDLPALSFDGGIGGQVDPASFPTALICTQSETLDMVFFAGRETDLKSFAEAISTAGCFREDPLTIVYAATGVPNTGGIQGKLERGNLNLVMASATHPGWARGQVSPPESFGEFKDHYSTLVTGDNTRLDDGYAIMHHDATATAVQAVRLAADETPEGILPTPEEVRGQLFHLHGGRAVPAAGGTLEFTESRQGDPGGKEIPIVLLGADRPVGVEYAGTSSTGTYITDVGEHP